MRPPEHSFLKAEQSQISQLLIPWFSQSCTGLSPVSPCLFYIGEPRAGHRTADIFHQCWARRRDHLPWLADIPPHLAWAAVGLLCCAGTLLVWDLLDIHQNPQILCTASFWLVSPASQGEDQVKMFPLLNFTRSLAAQFSSLSRSLWKSSTPIQCISLSSPYRVICQLADTALGHSSWIINKDFDPAGSPGVHHQWLQL